nr:unnamed protein product [Spirometra erinaceieuropaei]
MGRGTYFHALILPVSCYAGEIEKSASTDRQWRRKGRIEALYNSDDLARHMANHVMNQNPALSVTHISTPDLIPQGLWRDPYKIYATLFSQASRVLFLVTESDQDEFEDFFVNHLLHLFKRLQGHRSFSEWNTRFIVVVMGEFELPAVLCCENPPCEVVRFREIGWFRDSIALMLLYQKIKDYWVPPSQKEDLDQRILPHSTFEQPRRDFCIELEETETTTTSITIKNSVSSMIDDRQESVVRELIREVGEPSDYSECQSQSSSPLADMDYEKTDQLDESSDKKSVKKCRTRSLETSKSETQLYGKETVWSNDDESKRTSEETNWRSTSYAGFTESDERTEPFETPKSSPSNPKTPDTCECRDMQPQFPHLDDQATDLDPNYRGVEMTPTYSAISDKERAPENTEDSEPTDAMNTFALDNLSPLHGHGPTVPLFAEQSGYCLPPDKSATDMENSRYSPHNTKDIGQNGNAVLLDKGDILPGEQLDSEVTEAFQAISKYPDPINEGMSPVPIQKRGSATESPASNQISETSGKGALKGPTPTGSPCFERHLGHEPSGNTTDEFLASMEFTVTDTATRIAETGPACSTVDETPRSYSQNAEDDSLIGHEKVEHDHSAGSSVHTSKHNDAERYPEGDLVEEKGLHGKKSKDDSDAETKLGICVEGEEKDKLAGMDVSFAEASPADESELLTATYYPGEKLGLQDVAEEEEDVERLMEDRSAEAPSALASDVRRKRKLRQFLGMTHLSKRESANNADTVQNVSLESERATPSVGVKRPEEDPTNSQKPEEETEAVATNHAVEGEVRRFHRPESDRSHLDTPVGDNTIEGFVQEESNSRSGKGDSADISKTEKPAIIMRATEKSLEGLKGDIEGYTYSSDNEERQSAFTPTVVFKRSQYQTIRDSQVASKVVLERPGQEADDPYSKVEDTLVTHDRLRKPHFTPQLKWNLRSDEQFTRSQTEQPTKECTSQSVCEAEIGKSASKICKDPLMRPAEEGRNHYKPAELREVTSDAQKLVLPLDLPTLLKKDRRSPTNDSELSSPLFSLPSNEEDCVRTDSALRDNQYDSDSVSLSELMSTEHLQLPVPTESIQLPAQSILPYDQMPGLSSADEAGRQMAESLRDAEIGNLRSTADRMQVARREPTQTAPLFVAPRSHRMTEANKTAKTAYSPQSFQNVGLSPAQGKSDISDAEDVSNWKYYAHTGGVTEITPEGTISPSQPIQSTSMDYSIMKVYHEVGIYKRNICTQVDKHRIYCAADGEYFRDLKETLPHIKWQILKERCIGTSAYEPKKEDLSNIDSPVSLSAADSYGSEIYLLGGDLGEDDKISRVIETLKGLNAANQSDASTISSIIEALKAMRGGIQSAELFLSRLGFDMSTIIQKLQESKKY